jgi:hypothetical protein
LAFKSALRKKRDEGGQEGWGVGFGEYYQPVTRGNYFDDPAYDREHINNPAKLPLLGAEKYLLQGVKERLQLKKPVILVDFGGMLSLSFVRIAKELERDGHISNGDVILVVTNLNFDPNAKVVDRDINDERLDFFQRFKHLVHYINADARELQRMHVTVDGKEIPLRGNIDFLHENYALTHGSLNDVDWPLLARMLSTGGELIAHSSTESLHPGQRGYQLDYQEERAQAHELGVKNIIIMGLRRKDSNSDRNYDIFVK